CIQFPIADSQGHDYACRFKLPALISMLAFYQLYLYNHEIDVIILASTNLLMYCFDNLCFDHFSNALILLELNIARRCTSQPILFLWHEPIPWYINPLLWWDRYKYGLGYGKA